MEHVAIMRSGPLDQVICGTKTIESRWLVHKTAPFGRVRTGDIIYFKRVAGDVEAQARVNRVLQYEQLDERRVRDIIATHGSGLELTDSNYREWWHTAKKYCILIFLEDITRITPFQIDKRGFGNMAAWLCLPDGIDSIKSKS